MLFLGRGASFSGFNFWVSFGRLAEADALLEFDVPAEPEALAVDAAWGVA